VITALLISCIALVAVCSLLARQLYVHQLQIDSMNKTIDKILEIEK
jgi:hypothetical protein